ncbi:M23 family metallopeptidase [Thermospira aquatica]|uniref:M23 family metallopeptidase n=1 Tax=Thermospira aquatica TaxID=2828656 RepID=A0AAX3BG06_9SPIR|nr:M23 family metallopeptidase [Thermospira aquatica]URA11201.1 M23 family metallopeptidase [Thermospira aquatica]
MATYRRKDTRNIQVIRERNTSMYHKSGWQKFKEGWYLFWSEVGRQLRLLFTKIHEKGSQRLTIMVVPHSEKKTINIHISNYFLFFTTVLLVAMVITSMYTISENAQANKQVVILRQLDNHNRTQISEYKSSIESLSERFYNFKSDIGTVISGVSSEKNLQQLDPIEIKEESKSSVAKGVKNLEQMQFELDVIRENVKRLGKYVIDHKRLLREMPSRYPLQMRGRLTSKYGPRVDPVYKWKIENHPGIDLAVIPGTPILAAADGTVRMAEYHGGYGLVVEIQHKYGISTRYAHMMRFGPGIYPGAQVKQGQVIGYVGTTGKSTGYHLHYEVRIGGETVNPLPYATMLE